MYIMAMKKKIFRKRYTGIYYFANGLIELNTKQPSSTIKVLIHEIHHKIIHEQISESASVKYDNTSDKLERHIFSKN